MEIKKHGYKILIFFINSLLVVIAVLLIKDKDKNRFSFQSEDEIEFSPVSAEIINTQNAIAIKRENDLRNLNNSPKAIKQQNIITTTVTETPAKSSDRATRTS